LLECSLLIRSRRLCRPCQRHRAIDRLVIALADRLVDGRLHRQAELVGRLPGDHQLLSAMDGPVVRDQKLGYEVVDVFEHVVAPVPWTDRK